LLLSIKNKVVDSLKKQTLFVCFFISFHSFFAQNNLVINGGFDSLIQCPSNVGDINKAYSWFQPIRQVSTSDLYNSCSSLPISVPKNIMGYQNSFSYGGYSGIRIYANNYPNAREYIETKLSSPLKKDYTYCVEFYVSLADTANFAVSSIGAFFSKDSVLIDNLPNNSLISVTPQIQNDSLFIINDKKNWIHIAANFIAKGEEQFMTIGNFYDDIYTEKKYQKVSNFNVPTWSEGAYYYIENVSVYACDSPLVEDPKDTPFVFIPNVFSPNQDGENDLWEITASKVSSLNIQVFNRWGEQVYKTSLINTEEPTNFNPAWDGYTPTGKTVPEGTYFYIVQYTLPSGETKVEKGSLNLLR